MSDGQLNFPGDAPDPPVADYAEDYSRGMKKETWIAAEPTNGLDVESTHLFYDLISETAKQGTTVLFSTHLMDHVTKLCSHAVIINEAGRLVAQGSLRNYAPLTVTRRWKRSS